MVVGWVVKVKVKSVGMRRRIGVLCAARVICGLGRCHSQRYMYIGDMQVVRYILMFSVHLECRANVGHGQHRETSILHRMRQMDINRKES